MKYKLLLCDVDSTLIEQEVIDLLAMRSGRGQEVVTITNAAMRGEIDFSEALIERVKLLSGLPLSILDEVASEIKLSPGALTLREHCRTHGIKFGAVTGGFNQVLQRIPFFEELDFFRANSLGITRGTLNGEVVGAILDRRAKANYLVEFAESHGIEVSDCVAIGDGANDLDMVNLAGLGIAFRGKEILRRAADIEIDGSLAEVIPLLS